MSTQTGASRTYTIMEAAGLSGLPESTLRYYETIGIIDPITRGSSSKHRIYSEDDINMIISVACLNATGMSIEDMRAYLGNRSKGAAAAAEQIELLAHQRQRLHQEAKYLQLRQRYVDIKIAYWRAVATGDTEQVAAMKQVADEIAAELKAPHEK